MEIDGINEALIKMKSRLEAVTITKDENEARAIMVEMLVLVTSVEGMMTNLRVELTKALTVNLGK